MTGLRSVSVWLVAFLLAVVVAAFFTAISAAQLTGEETGGRILRRSVAVTTNIDAALPGIEKRLSEEPAFNEGGNVVVPDFPIAVELTPGEAETLRGAELRDRILDESAARLYDEGGGAWAANDPGADRNIERFSTAGAVNESLNLVRDDWHTVFVVIAVLLGIIALLMAGAIFIALPWDGRLLALGGVGVIAALPPLAAAVALRFAFRTADTDGDLFLEGLADVGADSMWVPIRNFFTLAVLSFLVLSAGSLLLWWESRNVSVDGGWADTGL